MQLSADRAILASLNEWLLVSAITERRAIIRYHRDQKGDDRCWVDDHAVWLMVDGLVTAPIVPFEYDAMMPRCERFHHCRNAEHPDPIPADAITDPAHWDDDLAAMSLDQLFEELVRIQEGIGAHYRAHHAEQFGTADDDRALYRLLPEKMPADLRLPPEQEFLGEARAPRAGCPAFIRSHDGCDSRWCDPTKWGPCIKK